MYKKLTILALCLLSILSVQVHAQTDYTLSSTDVVVTDGIIQSCSYDFTQNTDGTNLTIPEILDNQSIIGIADKENNTGVFYKKNIQALTLPSTIQIIGEYAFSVNPITSLYLLSCTALSSIGDYAFTGNSLTSLNLTGCSALTCIGDWAFYKNPITSLDLSACTALTSIENCAFYSNSITSLDLTNCSALISIGAGTFRDNSLTSLNLTGCTALVSIGEAAFYENSLTSFNLSSPEYVGFTFYRWEDANNNEYAAGDTITDLGISYTAIFNTKDYTLTSADVEVVDGIIQSCSFNFTQNPGGTNLTIPEILDNQRVIDIADKEFHNGVFYDKNIQALTLPSTIQTVGHYAFESNPITILDVTSCTELTNIEHGAFKYNSITNLDLTNCTALTSIDNYAFSENSITSLDLTNCSALISIGVGAFRYNSLTSLDLTNCTALTSIGEDAFYKNSIASLDLSSCTALTSIDNYAFYDNSITSLDLSSCTALTSIGERAFYENSITSLNLTNCSALTSIGNLAFCYNSITSLDLTNCTALTSIGEDAFEYNSIESLDLSSCTALTSIGQRAFSENSIASLNLTNCIALTSIDNYAFYDNSITSLDLSSCTALTSIGTGTFRDNSLTSFILPTHTILNSLGWTDSNDNSYEAGDSVTVLDTAYYIPGEGTDYFNINYELNGGSNSTLNPVVYMPSAGVGTFNDASKTSYVFEGWYTNENFETQLTSIAANSTSDTTLYAKWTANEYELIYNANSGVGTMNNQSIAIINTVNLIANAYTNTGYTFSGWNTVADGTGVAYADEAEYTMTTEGNTLYAQWVQVSAIDDVTTANLSLYPNPASKSVTILNATSGSVINIYSLAGTLVKQVQASAATQEINIADLNAGVYIVLCNGVSQRLIVQ